MTDPEDSSVGKTLSSARKKKRLRYKKISSELNIEESYLIALEEERFDFIPGGNTYIKGYLRSYAKKLDLNPDTIVKKYLEINADIVREVRNHKIDSNSMSSKGLIKNTIFFIFLFILVIFFFWILNKQGSAQSNNQDPPLNDEQITNFHEQQIYLSAEAIDNKSKSLEESILDYQTLPNPSNEILINNLSIDDSIPKEDLVHIKVKQECWLEVFSEEERLLYQLSQSGDEFIFQKDKIKLIVGNFKNVQVSFNDKIINLRDYANTNQVSCIVLPLGECSEFRSANN